MFENGRALQDLLYQAARVSQSLKRRGQGPQKAGTEGAQVYGAADQFRRLGVAAAGLVLEPLLPEHLRFLDDTKRSRRTA